MKTTDYISYRQIASTFYVDQRQTKQYTGTTFYFTKTPKNGSVKSANSAKKALFFAIPLDDTKRLQRQSETQKYF